jgi:hypothetical protein
MQARFVLILNPPVSLRECGAIPQFRSIEIRSGFAKAALARPIQKRFRTPENETELRFRNSALLALRHPLSTPPDYIAKLLKSDGAMCRYDHA